MDIGEWLRSLGLAQYEPAFREHAIDADVLAELTEGDLQGLGLPLGHRKRLLRAVRALGAAGPAAEPPPPALEAPQLAERRQLTVLFCDLVGSSALSHRLDPEELRELIRRYQDAVSGAVGRHGGYVANFLGDGVVAYFGWPRADEDNAAQAIRAGLEAIAAVRRLPLDDGGPLSSRVGIASGTVVVGDLEVAGRRQAGAIAGDTPNLAARLQALAEADQLVIDSLTRQLVGTGFVLDELGPQALKGFPEPVPAARVLAERATESRFEALRGVALVPLVGRGEELGLLLRCWEQAKAGSGQAVLVAGEPGIGKSRLTRALQDAIAAQPHIELRLFCSPHHQDSALHPFIAQLERAAGFNRDDTDEARLAKLDTVLAHSDATDEAVALIAELLSIPTGRREWLWQMTPQARRERTLVALLTQLTALAARGPVLVVHEDVHWIDPTSRELLDRIIGRLERLPVLLLATFRPEFQPPWTGQPNVTSLALARLDQHDTAAMIAEIAGADDLPPEIVQEIAERTDGVPLFIEEVTRAAIETGAQADKALASVPHPSASVPAMLHASLVARLDQLGPAARDIAQRAAAIGREFRYELVAAIADRPEPELREALERLTSAGLLFVRGIPPEATYLFKHALVQDTAYGTLLRAARQQVHARIAMVLEQQWAETATSQPELLAHHFTQAKLAAKAVMFWRRAGERATERSANLEAIKHLSKGIDLIKFLPEAQQQNEELALWTAKAIPLIATQGYSAVEVETAYKSARDLCERLHRSEELFPVLRGLWNCYAVRGELQRAHTLAEQLVVLAASCGDPLRRAVSQRAMGTTLFFLGRFADASRYLNKGIAFADEAGERAGGGSPHLLLYGEHAGIMCQLYSGWTLWFLGLPDRAVIRLEAGLALARQLSHAHVLAFALNFAANLYCFRREFDIALTRAEEAIHLTTQHVLPQWRAMATMLSGIARLGLGQRKDGLADLTAGLSGWERIDARLGLTQYLAELAYAYADSGQIGEAFAAFKKAQETAALSMESWYEPELHRLRGNLLLRMSKERDAEESLVFSVGIAQRQDSKSLELRAAVSLARLWREQGRSADARDLLAPIFGWFTEGFGTKDLREARALLDELG